MRRPGPSALPDAAEATLAPRSRLSGWLQALAKQFAATDTGRLRDSVRAAELDGLVFAFWVRALAILAVTLWLMVLVPWPRDAYYASYAITFFILGLVPYRLRRHRHAQTIKLLFVVLDVALVATAILLPPPVVGADWPVQTRLRGQEYLYLLLLLGEAALTYSPWLVIWTGLVIVATWSAGVLIIYVQPETTTFAQLAAGGTPTSGAILQATLEPRHVGLVPWWTQIVATGLLTLMLAAAVWRGRSRLLAHVGTEIVRADLARYVSPDLVQALVRATPQGFGEPATRRVAILFADIVGFTAHAERLSPEQTFAMLRSFRERSCRTVFAHGGTLDKYLGDGFMATFGAIDPQDDAAARALACAFDLQAEIDRWNATRRAGGVIALSVGVHCGPVTAGNLGSDSRSEFTVVGDVVNVASRLESATRAFEAAIVASDDCVRGAGGAWAARFDRVTELRPRGREQVLRVHLAARQERGARPVGTIPMG